MLGSSRELHAKLDALSKSQAIIEFKPDGTIVTANANFLKALGYELDEICGRHHQMFVPEAQRNSTEYAAFWAKLGRGEFDAREYLRFGKGGAEIWIQASYNPVRNARGAVTKVVKVATVITDDKVRNADYERQDRSDLPGAGRHRVHPGRPDPDGQRELLGAARIHAAGDPGKASPPVRRAGVRGLAEIR